MEGFMTQSETYKFHPVGRSELNLAHKPYRVPWRSRLFALGFLEIFLVIALSSGGALGLESVIRTTVQVNADKDLVTMADHISNEIDVIGCSSGGRKYVGWDEICRGFGSVAHPNTHISDLLIKTKSGVAGSSGAQVSSDSPQSYDLSGEWEILEVEDDRTYRATLDRQGNGPYTWQGGQFTTTSFKDRRWQGTWKQTGNDREGGFELVLSEDEAQAKGIWWYVRVGIRNNIPPREHGGSYVWKRLNSSVNRPDTSKAEPH